MIVKMSQKIRICQTMIVSDSTWPICPIKNLKCAFLANPTTLVG